MSTKILIKLASSDKPQAVTPEVYHDGPYGFVVLGPVVLGGVPAAHLAGQLRNLANQLQPGMTFSARVDAITEAEVVEHFENSPHLQTYAPDVRSVLGAEARPGAPGTDVRLLQDFQAIAHLKNPSQADVAEILFGDRTLTGGAYRRRILAAMELLRKTTTTGQNNGHGHAPAADRAA